MLPTLLTKAKLAAARAFVYQPPLTGWLMKVSTLVLLATAWKSAACRRGRAEVALLDIDQQVTHAQERVGSLHGLLSDLESDRGDDRIVRQAGGVEGQDGPILLVERIVAEVEDGGRRIE